MMDPQQQHQPENSSSSLLSSPNPPTHSSSSFTTTNTASSTTTFAALSNNNNNNNNNTAQPITAKNLSATSILGGGNNNNDVNNQNADFQTPLVSSLTYNQRNNPRIQLQRQAVEALNDLLTSEHQHRHCTCCCLSATKEFAKFLIQLSLTNEKNERKKQQQQQQQQNNRNNNNNDGKTKQQQQQQQQQSLVDEEDEDSFLVLPSYFRPKTCTCKTSTHHNNHNNNNSSSSSPPDNNNDDVSSSSSMMMNPKCCSTVINFLTSPNYLSNEVRIRLARALYQFSESRSLEHPKAKFSCRYTLAVLISGLAQEFFAFWEELPPGIETVSLSDQPKVVGIGGDKGSVVFEIGVVKEEQEDGEESETDTNMGSMTQYHLNSTGSGNLLSSLLAGGKKTSSNQLKSASSSAPRSPETATTTNNNNNNNNNNKEDKEERSTRAKAAVSSSPYGGSVVPPSHLQQTDRFCVKVTRYSHHGLRTPKKGISRVPSGDSLSILINADQQQQQQNSNNTNNETVVIEDQIDNSLLLDQQQQQPQNPSTSMQERQFYGLIKSAATLHSSQKVSNRLLVPFASLDPGRFGKLLDPPSVAQCLLLEQWDGDLRWAKESFAKFENAASNDNHMKNGNNSSSAEDDVNNNNKNKETATTVTAGHQDRDTDNKNELSVLSSDENNNEHYYSNNGKTGFENALEELSQMSGGGNSRGTSASHGVGRSSSAGSGGLIENTNFQRATANARKQTAKKSFPLNPSPPKLDTTTNNTNNDNKSNNLFLPAATTTTAQETGEENGDRNQQKDKKTPSKKPATKKQQNVVRGGQEEEEKPIYIPPFLLKFAKKPINNNATSGGVTGKTAATTTSSASSSTTAAKTTAGDTSPKTTESKLDVLEKPNSTIDTNNDNNSITEAAMAQTTVTSPSLPLQSPESLHETLRIFHTNQRFIPVVDFDSLGCFAFQLFSALHLMHDELPHLSLSSGSVSSSTTVTTTENNNNNNNNNNNSETNSSSSSSTTTTYQHHPSSSIMICSGYVHNDLHSGNILVRVDDRRICLCDFEHVSDVITEEVKLDKLMLLLDDNDDSDGKKTHQTIRSSKPANNGNKIDNSTNSSATQQRKQQQQQQQVNSLLDAAASAASSPFRITPRAYTPPELVSTPKRDVWAATLIVFEMFLGVCPLVNALEASNDMSDCYLTVHEEFGLDWRHFAQLLKDFGDDDNNNDCDLHDDEAIKKAKKTEFLNFCSKGLTNNPLNRATAREMLNHPFLAKKSEKEWEKLIRNSPPYWQQ